MDGSGLGLASTGSCLASPLPKRPKIVTKLKEGSLTKTTHLRDARFKTTEQHEEEKSRLVNRALGKLLLESYVEVLSKPIQKKTHICKLCPSRTNKYKWFKMTADATIASCHMTNMMSHFKKKHSKDYLKLLDVAKADVEGELEAKPKLEGPIKTTQATLSSAFGTGENLRELSLDVKQELDLLYTRFIISTGSAQTLGKDEFFRALFRALGVKWVPPSPRTYERLVCVDRTFHEGFLAARLREASSFWHLPVLAVQYDLWSSSKKQAYIGVQARWIAPTGELELATIAMQLVTGKHTAQNIATWLCAVVDQACGVPVADLRSDEFGLVCDQQPQHAGDEVEHAEDGLDLVDSLNHAQDKFRDLSPKLASIVSDGAANCMSANGLLGFQNSVHCAAHRLHLVVDDGFLFGTGSSLDPSAFELLGLKDMEIKADRLLHLILEASSHVVANKIVSATKTDWTVEQHIAEIEAAMSCGKQLHATQKASMHVQLALFGVPGVHLVSDALINKKKRIKHAKALLKTLGSKVYSNAAKLLKGIVTKIKARVSILHKSTQMREFFHDIAAILGLLKREPPQNCVTRWTSFYRILEFEVRFSDALSLTFDPSCRGIDISTENRDKIKALHRKVQPFKGSRHSMTTLRLDKEEGEPAMVRELHSLLHPVIKTNLILQRKHKSLAEAYFNVEFLKAFIWADLDEVMTMCKVEDHGDEDLAEGFLELVNETMAGESAATIDLTKVSVKHDTAKLTKVTRLVRHRISASLDARFDRVPDDMTLLAIYLDPRYRTMLQLLSIWSFSAAKAAYERSRKVYSESIPFNIEELFKIALSQAKGLRKELDARAHALLKIRLTQVYHNRADAEEAARGQQTSVGSNCAASNSESQVDDEGSLFDLEKDFELDNAISSSAKLTSVLWPSREAACALAVQEELAKYRDVIRNEVKEVVGNSLKFPTDPDFNLESVRAVASAEAARQWWFSFKAADFPLMKHVFAHVFTTDATTASTEGLFSRSALIQTDLRKGRLGPLAMSNFTFMRSNLTELQPAKDVAKATRKRKRKSTS